ncbi:MAG: LD-carboxypeptidase [Bacteroidetes bacterium]|nr:LD-carboxypeptidase [Bacteroidota bacterium]
MISNPPYLSSGDTVVLIAPARSVSTEDIQHFRTWVESQGWHLEFAPNMFATQDQFAGNDQQRGSDLCWALSHPTAKAIFTARGGYGSMRTLEALSSIVGSSDTWIQQQSPKWFVGFSDMTTLHLWLRKNNWASIHGPVATQWGLKHALIEQNIGDLASVLKGNEWHLNVNASQVVNPTPFRGELVGGNLSLLYAALGTPLQPDTNNKILLIEDLDEYLYHIDRMIRSCNNAGLFSNLKALIVGSMIDMKDNQIPFGKSCKDIIVDALANQGFPILFDVEIGHDERNHAVKLGCDITFDLSKLAQKP